MFKKVSKVFDNNLKRYIYLTLPNFTNIPTFPTLDIDYLCKQSNVEEITNNIAARKGIGNINLVLDLKSKLDSVNPLDENYNKIRWDFYNELCKIPNKTHPAIVKLKDEANVISYIGKKREFTYKPLEFYEITKRLNLLRTDQLGNVSGNRSYFLLGEMAELEHALIKYTISNLRKRHFQLISVPDILHRSIIEGCGLNTRGERAQVYTLDPKMHEQDLCLSGTSEMALAGLFINKTLSEKDLPMKLAAVSRCYRAEISSTLEERGIYRVHQFTKVEMFGLSTPHMSDEMLEEFRKIEEDSFSNLGLHLRTLDMPPHELGAPAYRKYDIEAWLPGRNVFGEISSCSNCTDYQSRRLDIKYKTKDDIKYVHTLNGTACAIPRMLIAVIETYQNNKGFISIPEILQKYIGNKNKIERQKTVPELKLIKHKK